MDIILNIIYYVIPFIILLGILVFVHEFGHFFIARMLGVSVSAFSIGFGKELWSHTDKHGTIWKLCAVPLGGYCQFLGDADASSSTEQDISNLSEEEKKTAFTTQKHWKKLAIVSAGPLFNYLFAVLVFIGIFYAFGKMVYPPVVAEVMADSAAERSGIKAGDIIKMVNGHEVADFSEIGKEVSLSTQADVPVDVERHYTLSLTTANLVAPCGCKPEKLIGIISQTPKFNEETKEVTFIAPYVGSVLANSPAEKAGILPGDRLVSVNGVEIKDFRDLKNYAAEHSDEVLELKTARDLKFNVILKEQNITNSSGATEKRRILGVVSARGVVVKDKSMTFIKAVKEGFYETYSLTVSTLRAVGQMVTGQRSGKEVGGIIRIAEMSGDISKSGGFISFIYFMALLSVNLGLINLLPIPVLDGGHIVIFLCEMITRRELKTQIKDYIFKFGLLIILAIMVLATWNDISHLITRWFN